LYDVSTTDSRLEPFGVREFGAWRIADETHQPLSVSRFDVHGRVAIGFGRFRRLVGHLANTGLDRECRADETDRFNLDGHLRPRLLGENPGKHLFDRLAPLRGVSLFVDHLRFGNE
jgi:hypothetical protein